MITTSANDPRFILDLTTVLIGICVILSSLEDLVHYHSFSDDGLQSWRVSRLNYRWTVRGPIKSIADGILSFPRFRWLIAVRLAAVCLLLTFQLSGWLQALILFILSVSTLAYNVRSPYGLSGDHQMTIVVVVTLFFASLAMNSDLIQRLCLWFIAIQGVLSYVIAGWSKLGSHTWRTGEALLGIMRTEIYGNQTYYQLLQRWPVTAVGAAWLTISFESLFFLVFVKQTAVTIGLLAVGMLFHLHNAFVMRLNLFFWAFIATYPAILFCALSLH